VLRASQEMLQDTDLDAAVSEGIVTEAQATALRELARQRERERAIALGHEERFRFMRGFNDVFFAIGVVLFVAGLLYFTPRGTTGFAVAAAVVWGLAELLVGRLRLVLPGILLASVFVVLVFLAAAPVPLESGLPFETRPMFPPSGVLEYLHFYPGGPLAFAGRALIAAAAAAAFYWRFKLPFALLPLAASLIVAALGVASFLLPQWVGISDAVIMLACGLAVFAAAMAFDASDRERLTRRADCAFWLHLLAAPLIVRSAMLLAASPLAGAIGVAGEPLRRNMNTELAVAVMLIVAVLAVVALLIDRRALLVAGLAYLGAAIGFALTGTRGSGVPADGAFVVATTLVILGALVLTLGVGWVPLRRRLLALLSPAISNRLPPVPARP
jgi:hypothetical protein